MKLKQRATNIYWDVDIILAHYICNVSVKEEIKNSIDMDFSSVVQYIWFSWHSHESYIDKHDEQMFSEMWFYFVFDKMHTNFAVKKSCGQPSSLVEFCENI